MGLVSFKSGGGVLNTGYKPSSITNLTVKRSQKTAALTWTDPEDFTVDDTPCAWTRTVLIRKSGSAPQSIHDGTEVAVITERNKHTETPWVDGVLELDVTYYYAAYVVSTDGLISDLSNIVSITIPTPRTMTVVIDLNDSNPETCGSYADDAVDMPYGKTDEAITAWQDFFGYKPCLFKDGKVVGYLNPNDYSKFEDGTPADITSGNAGDVMVEFPRRGVKISKSGKVITVSMTDDLDNPEFTFYAHTRGDQKRDYFYLGAYPGSHTEGGKLRSLSNQVVLGACTITEFREYAHNNGSGYEQLIWFQWIFIQAMYVLQFRANLDSQSTVGSGDSSDERRTTGSLDLGGLICTASPPSYRVKIFGLEDIWGYNMTAVDGFISAKNTIWTTTNNFNDKHSDYTNQCSIPILYGVGYISNVDGTSELGFLPTEIDGSETTYFCDKSFSGSSTNGTVCAVGGFSGSGAGLFAIDYHSAISYGSYSMVSRLSYY